MLIAHGLSQLRIFPLHIYSYFIISISGICYKDFEFKSKFYCLKRRSLLFAESFLPLRISERSWNSEHSRCESVDLQLLCSASTTWLRWCQWQLAGDRAESCDRSRNPTRWIFQQILRDMCRHVFGHSCKCCTCSQDLCFCEKFRFARKPEHTSATPELKEFGMKDFLGQSARVLKSATMSLSKWKLQPMSHDSTNLAVSGKDDI